MASERGIYDRGLDTMILHDIHHRRQQESGLPRKCTSRLHDDFEVRIFGLERLQQPDQMFRVIVFSCHQMPASHIQPFDMRQETAETLFYFSQRLFQIIRTRFAKRMKMQALDTVGQLTIQKVANHSHPGARSARIIQIRFDIRIFRIDAQTARYPVSVRLHHRIETFELRKRIERHMTTVS